MTNEQKGLGSKIKRLFVETDEREQDPADAALSAADAVAAIAKQSAPAAKIDHDPASTSAPASKNPPAPLTGVEPAKVDFASIYKAAGMTDAELEAAGRAEQLLRTLPANLPVETQRQILEGALKTFGVEPTRIRATLQRQQRALGTYANIGREDAAKRDNEGRARIEQLRAEVTKLERAAEDRARAQAGVELACKNQSEATGRIIDYLPPPAAAPEKP